YPALEDGQAIGGATSGFVPTIGSGSGSYLTQTVLSNLSSNNALMQVVASPPASGENRAPAFAALVPAHRVTSYPDTVKKLGLGSTFSGQLSWSSNQPLGVLARNVTKNKQYSGIEPGHSLADASSTVMVPYVEDTTTFATALEISNPG